MTLRALTWAHVGDVHADEADGFASVAVLRAIVTELNGPAGQSVDWVYLPGDNANHGTADQYRRLLDPLASLRLPWRMIPGDHDGEPGSLAAYHEAIPRANRPEVEVIAGHRCIFLDIVSAGSGGPDFRLSMHDRRRLAGELARARAAATPAAVFMHVFPGDLAADADEVAQTLAAGGAAFVDTGHTHYNELLNDGRVLYGATRSTGQNEEGGPGYTVVTLRDGVASWHFRPLGGTRPFVRIVAPAEQRLVTRPADPRQVPRPGLVTVVARIDGGNPRHATLSVDGRQVAAMTCGRDEWTATVLLPAGLHHVVVEADGGEDAIDVLVRDIDALPKRSPPVALGNACHSIGTWTTRHLPGTRLGPNANGRDW